MSSNLPAQRRRSEAISCAGCERATDCLGAFLDSSSAVGSLSRSVLRRGDHLYRTGDPMDFLYIVSSGAFKSYLISPEGDEQVLGFNLPGDVLGIDSVTSPRFQSSAVAIAPSHVCRMPADAIRRGVGESPEFRDRLVVRMGREIHRLTCLLHLGRRTAEQRIAAFLLSQAHKLEAEGFPGRAHHLPMSRRDIGHFLGLAVETVSRVFTRLQRGGVLRAGRHSLEIRNMERLIEVSSDGLPGGGSAQRKRPRPLVRTRVVRAAGAAKPGA